MNQLTLQGEKSIAARFRTTRADDRLQYQVEKRHLQTVMTANDIVAQCEPDSLADCLLQAGGLGLSLNPALSHLYVIPYKADTDAGRVYRAQLMIGYRGLLHQCHRASTIKTVQANLVCEHDPVFQVYTDETGRRLRHEEARGNRGPVTHAYCLAVFTDGGHHVEVMDAGELEACQRAAQSRNARGGAVWRGPFKGEMQKKSVMRRAIKWWPMDPEGVLQRTQDALDSLEPADFGDGVCLSDDQQLALHAMCIDAGMPEKVAAGWMKRLPKVYGFASLADVPADSYDRIRDSLAHHIQSWREKHAVA